MASHGNMKRRLLNWSANLLTPYQTSDILLPISLPKLISTIHISAANHYFKILKKDINLENMKYDVCFCSRFVDKTKNFSLLYKIIQKNFNYKILIMGTLNLNQIEKLKKYKNITLKLNLKHEEVLKNFSYKHIQKYELVFQLLTEEFSILVLMLFLVVAFL